MLSAVLVLWLSAALFADREAALARARRSYELSRTGRLAEAVAEMRAAIGLDPHDALLYSALGGLLVQQGEDAEAITCFAKAVDLAPDNAALRERLHATGLEIGARLARQHRYRHGLALAEDMVRRFPESPPVLEMLGLFQTKNQQNVAAVATYGRAWELAPDSAGAAIGLGIAAAGAGLPDQASTAFQKALSKFPDNVAVLQAYGVFLLREADVGRAGLDQAIRMFEKAIQIDPDASEAHLQLGIVALNEGRLERALESLQKAARSGLDDSRLHYALARVYRRLGNTAEAERELATFRDRKASEQP